MIKISKLKAKYKGINTIINSYGEYPSNSFITLSLANMFIEWWNESNSK